MMNIMNKLLLFGFSIHPNEHTSKYAQCIHIKQKSSNYKKRSFTKVCDDNSEN